ncbi:MAG: pseudouridine synthase [Bacteriovoracaceae bacterium]
MQIKVVFENEFIMVVDKPSGVLSVPSRLGEKEERPILGLLLQDQLKIQIYPIHRLDAEVSGIVMYAKTAEAHRVANLWFEHKLIHKTYCALTEGKSDLQIGVENSWKCKLLRGKKRAYESPHGKDSLTLATLRKKTDTGLLWDLSPVTGRSHQLRYELYRHGYPILGDTLYNSTQTWTDGIALRSYAIDLEKISPDKRLDLPVTLQISSFSDNIIG